MYRIEAEVLIGSNDELYLAGGRHFILEFARGERQVNKTTITNFAENIASRRRICDGFGAPYVHLVAPEKYKVYREDFPIEGAKSFADLHAAAGLVPDYLYPDEILRSETGGRTYFRTDTHWAPHGQALITKTLAARFGRSPADCEAIHAELLQRLVPRRLIGDLGGKLTPKIEENALRLEPSLHVSAFDNGISQVNSLPVNDGKLDLVVSTHPHAKGRLLIFGSSFSQTTLPYLAAAFKEIICCRTRFFHDEMIYMVKPDFVLSEMAERYMGNVSPDSAAPPFLLMPQLLQRDVKWKYDALQQAARLLGRGRDIDFSIFHGFMSAAKAEAEAKPGSAQG